MCDEDLKILIAVLIPFALYGLAWLVGRAYNAGKLHAFRKFFRREKRK